VDGSIAASSGTTVKNHGTLAGSGTVGAVAVQFNGTLTAGGISASAGILHTGNVAIASGGDFSVELGGTTPGTEHDQLDVTGTVNVAGANLLIQFVNGLVTSAGDSFLVIKNDGVDAVTGKFAASSDMVQGDVRAFKIDYHAGDGNDVSITTAGFAIHGTSDADVVDGSTSPDFLPTADGDLIFGFEGNDQLDGLAGDDVLVGGLGKDILTGGLGADSFDFNSTKETRTGAKRDVINGFDRGADHIDLVDIDAKSGGGNQAFKFIGKAAFHHLKGELHYFKQGHHVIVEGDTNGDGHADFQIQVNGVTKLGAGDFFL
jgi:Ca2+-binding RTX toxin-like protein